MYDYLEIILIAAVSQNDVIGNKGKIPWYSKEERISVAISTESAHSLKLLGATNILILLSNVTYLFFISKKAFIKLFFV